MFRECALVRCPWVCLQTRHEHPNIVTSQLPSATSVTRESWISINNSTLHWLTPAKTKERTTGQRNWRREVSNRQERRSLSSIFPLEKHIHSGKNSMIVCSSRPQAKVSRFLPSPCRHNDGLWTPKPLRDEFKNQGSTTACSEQKTSCPCTTNSRQYKKHNFTSIFSKHMSSFGSFHRESLSRILDSTKIGQKPHSLAFHYHDSVSAT